MLQFRGLRLAIYRLRTGAKSSPAPNASGSWFSSRQDFRNWRGGVEAWRIGHDLSTEDWATAVENALLSFERTPYILQKFHKAKRRPDELLRF